MTSFVEQAKKMSIVFATAGVIGLTWLLANSQFGIAKNVIDFSFTEKTITLMRLFLNIYEFFWLFVIAWGFWKLSKKAGIKLSDEETEKFEGYEGNFMKVMAGILLVAALMTMLLPIWVGNGLAQYNTNADYDKAVTVVAQQFDFTFTMDNLVDSNITFKVGVRYMFQLSTLDTTHGFGLYSPDRVFLLQAQIVPGYTTNLLVIFGEVGQYIVRCMEYCAIGHHSMESDGIGIPFLTVEA